MTTELTLREKVLAGMTQLIEDGFGVEVALNYADDLRGMVVEPVKKPVVLKGSQEITIDAPHSLVISEEDMKRIMDGVEDAKAGKVFFDDGVLAEALKNLVAHTDGLLLPATAQIMRQRALNLLNRANQ